MNTKLMFSSKSPEWETPLKLFEELDREFHFTLDPCATPENTKCKRYFTSETDGLKQNWKGQRVFMNPPYGKEISLWVKKASENPLTVALLPARTDTKWFHEYILGKAEIRFLKGRLKFGNAQNSAPFPSVIAIFK